MALVELNSMSFYAHHGCYEQEQKVGGRFSVDFAFRYDSTSACVSDDISDTVSYLDVYQVIGEQMAQTSHLLENVAHRILCCVGDRFSEVSWARVRIEKLNPPLGGKLHSSSVVLEREY